MINEIFDKLSSNTESINTFINNREAWKSLQSQIDEVNKTLNILKEIKTIHDAKIVEFDDKIQFLDNIFKYKLWSCEKYHEDRHIPVNDFLRLLDIDMVRDNHFPPEYYSLILTGGYDYFNGKDGWVSKLSSDEHYRISKAVRLYKKFRIHFDGLIDSDVESKHQIHNYLNVLEQLHISYSNKSITDERFMICRKTLLLLKEDGLLN